MTSVHDEYVADDELKKIVEMMYDIAAYFIGINIQNEVDRANDKT